MSREPRHCAEPPRLLLGAALLFWSGMIGHPLVGLLCAVLVEGRAWFQLRWEFGERAFVRAWTASVLILMLSFVWVWMEGAGRSSLFRVLSWLPVYFLPLILVQQYSIGRWMLLNTFSMFARRKMQVDRKKGREVDPMKIHFGYIYMMLILIAAALGQTNKEVFYVGLCIFLSLSLYFSGDSSRQRPVVWGIAVVVAMLLGFGGSKLLDSVYGYFENGRHYTGGSSTFPSEQTTSIGKVGRLKLSHRIHWRVKTNGRNEPSLYREAVYNIYGQGLWRHDPGRGITQTEDWANEMATRGDQGDDDYRFVFDRRDFDINEDGAVDVEITGPLEIPGPTPVPLPSETQMIRGLQADGIDYNSLGTVIVANPDSAVTRFRAYLGQEIRHEEDPYSETDLSPPYVAEINPEGEPGYREEPSLPEISDREALKIVVDQLGIRGATAREAMTKLRHYFATEFDYTLYRSTRISFGARRRGAIAVFLLDPKYGKEGHCEYFATAATLLLREAGIPARYAVGYAAKERGSGEGQWLLRGKHGHAWCRVYEGGRPGEPVVGSEGEISTQWSGGKWKDFDPTPSSWLAVEGSGLPWDQKIMDFWLVVRQDLQVWRSKEENRVLITMVMGTLGFLTLSYVIVRLWYSRLRRSPNRKAGQIFGDVRSVTSPLLSLENLLEKRQGPRPEGQPLAQWVKEAGRESPSLEKSLAQAARYHWKARFDPLGLEEDEIYKFIALCSDLKRDLG